MSVESRINRVSICEYTQRQKHMHAYLSLETGTHIRPSGSLKYPQGDADELPAPPPRPTYAGLCKRHTLELRACLLTPSPPSPASGYSPSHLMGSCCQRPAPPPGSWQPVHCETREHRPGAWMPALSSLLLWLGLLTP